MMSLSLRRRSRGVSLIEVLISILLMSLSLLGLSKLMGVSYAFSKNAQTTMIANGIVINLVERARVNLLGFDNGQYKLGEAEDVEVGSRPTDFTVGSSAAYVALVDKAKIKQLTAISLPGGTLAVNTDVAGYRRQMEVWVYWNASDSVMASYLTGLNGGTCPAAKLRRATTCMYFKEFL